MKVTLGILVQLGNSNAIEVTSTTAGASFSLPARVFNVAAAAVGVSVSDNKVTFKPLGDGPFLRVFVAYNSPTEKASFLVTYDPATPFPEGNPAVWVWNADLATEPNEVIGAFWDHQEEKIIHLAQHP